MHVGYNNSMKNILLILNILVSIAIVALILAQLELVGVGVWGGVVFGGGGVLARGGAICLLPRGAVVESSGR